MYKMYYVTRSCSKNRYSPINVLLEVINRFITIKIGH